MHAHLSLEPRAQNRLAHPDLQPNSLHCRSRDEAFVRVILSWIADGIGLDDSPLCQADL